MLALQFSTPPAHRSSPTNTWLIHSPTSSMSASPPTTARKVGNIAGREYVHIHKNWALGDNFLQFGTMLGMGIKFSKTTANTAA